jgi:PAS domain S-box-containing protein
MAAADNEDELLRSAALQNASSILSARRRAEESLRLKTEELAQQREWFSVTLASIGDAVITTDTENRVTYLNPVAENLTGWKLAEAKSQPLDKVFNIINEYTRARAENPVAQVLREGNIIGLANHTALIAKDGRETSIEDSAAPIKNSAGKIIGAVMVFHDVTEQRRAQESVGLNERFNRAIVESSRDCMKTLSLDGTFLWLSGAAQKILCVTDVKELLGKSWVDLWTGEDRILAQTAVAAAARGEMGDFVGYMEVGGQDKWWSVVVTPILDAEGRPEKLLAVSRDVTERKKADEALRRSEEELRALADSMSQLAWMAEPDGNIFWYNRRWYDYTGTTWEAMKVWGWQPLHDPKILPLVVERWRDSLQTGQPFEMEHPLRGANGMFRWFLTRARPLRDVSGKVMRWFGTNTDITEQRETRQKLQISLELEKAARAESDLAKLQFRSLFESAPGNYLVLTADDDYRIVAVSDAYLGATMTERDALLNRKLFEVFPDDPNDPNADGVKNLRASLERLRKNNQADVMAVQDYAIRKPDGSFEQRQWSPINSPALDANGKLTFIIHRVEDVTEYVQLQRQSGNQADLKPEEFRIYRMGAEVVQRGHELVQSNQKLFDAKQVAESASRAKDHFIAALSHELRTPLTPVLALLSNLAEDVTLSKTTAADLETVRRNVELEVRLIDDLLDLTRITRSKLDLHYVRTSISQIIEDAVNTCVSDMNAKRISLVREISNAEQMVFTDSTRVTQILWNLLKNSIKFTPEEGTITVRSYFTSDGDANKITIEVQDTGIGIKPENINRVFDAFEQGDHTVTRQFGGLGLGLAISRAIAEAHQGTLTAVSNGQGLGSTFTLKLPVHEQSSKFISPAKDISTDATTAASGIAKPAWRILLVEDHADTANSLAMLLRRRGFAVSIAATVAGAVELASAETFDLLVSDLGLPDATGYECMQRVRQIQPIPGIALSGYGMEDDIEKCHAAGFTEHLVKPIRITQLEEIIRRIFLGG